MIQPYTPQELYRVFSNDPDGWEEVEDRWDEVAAGVLDLVRLANAYSEAQRAFVEQVGSGR